MVALQKMWKRVEISYQCPCERNGLPLVQREKCLPDTMTLATTDKQVLRGMGL